jgi:hypothetical protein
MATTEAEAFALIEHAQAYSADGVGVAHMLGTSSGVLNSSTMAGSSSPV